MRVEDMRIVIYALLLLVSSGLGACSVTEIVETQMLASEKQESTSIIVSTDLPPTTTKSTPIATRTPIVVDLSTTVAANASMTEAIISTPLQITTIGQNDHSLSNLPPNVWWSEDSHFLYYQNSEMEQGWKYNLANGKTAEIPYIARTYDELAPQISETLPENAKLLSISPSNKKILYQIPLSEPIQNLNGEESADNPPYLYELWVRQNERDIKLGKVDGCFGGLGPHLWSANEMIIIVNTTVLSNPCLHRIWLVDLEETSVGSLDSPWEGEDYEYSVSDLSHNGRMLLIRADKNYFFDRTTKEKWPIPNTNTSNIILTGTEAPLGCLVVDKKFSETFFQTDIWSCRPESGKGSLLATIETNIVDWVISPDRKYIAFIGKDQDFFPEMEALPEGIWLMSLP